MSPSTSDPVSVMSLATFLTTLTDWLLATGGSFTGVTVMLTVAGADVSDPSVVVKVKLSLPLKLGTGVYVRAGTDPVSVPCAGPLTTANVKASPSGSEPVSVIALGVSSFVVTLWLSATGALLGGPLGA